MKKATHSDNLGAPILYHSEPANAGHENRPERDFRRWKHGWQWLECGSPGPQHWRVASMKTAFSTTQPAPEHGTPWHEVAALRLSPWAYSEAFAGPADDAWQRFGILKASLPLNHIEI